MDRVDGVGPSGELLVRVRAAPAGGAANTALLRAIAAVCDVAPSRVSLLRGAAGRRKIVAISGIRATVLTQRWPDLIVS